MVETCFKNVVICLHFYAIKLCVNKLIINKLMMLRVKQEPADAIFTMNKC